MTRGSHDAVDAIDAIEAPAGPDGLGPLVPAAFAELIAGRPAEAVERGCGVAGSPSDGRIDGDSWLARLPRLVEDQLARWELRRDGASRHGVCALVVPVRRRDGSPAALKLTWPHAESRHEHLALRAWAGQGAVRLLAASPADHALLLERLEPDVDLTAEPIDEACTRIGSLLRRLDRPALPQLDRLSTLSDALQERLREPCPAVPRRFVDQARSLASDLSGDADVDDRLVHTDLHFENVLRGGPDRPGEWVAIDPKPLAADPAYAVWPVLHNRWAEVLAGDVAWEVRCRLGWVCDAAELDEESARSWAIVRTVAQAVDLAREDPRVDLTAQVTLLKALQPGA